MSSNVNNIDEQTVSMPTSVKENEARLNPGSRETDSRETKSERRGKEYWDGNFHGLET
jgi:hypothetical protein